MSTRAIYSFESDYGTVHVYKHHDGYPTGAAAALKAAVMFAWPRPRYEGDEFAAAFVAANKMCGQGGAVRLIPQGLKPQQFASDVEYRYVISKDGLRVTAFRTSYWDGSDKETFLFSTTFGNFARRAKAYAKK